MGEPLSETANPEKSIGTREGLGGERSGMERGNPHHREDTSSPPAHLPHFRLYRKGKPYKEDMSFHGMSYPGHD
jgi:hypothetical protein